MDRRTIYVSTAPHPDQFFRVRLLSFLHSSAVQTVWINRFSLLALMIYRSQKSLNVRASGCCFLFFLILNTFDSIQHNTVQCCSFSKLSSWPNRGKRLLWCISFFFSPSLPAQVLMKTAAVFLSSDYSVTDEWRSGHGQQTEAMAVTNRFVILVHSHYRCHYFGGGIGSGGWG